MTRQEFATCMAVLEAGCATPIATMTVDVWFSVLGDLPVESLQAAVTRVLAERTYTGLPPVGQLRQLACEWQFGTIATPEQAYARMREGFSRFGARLTQEERDNLRQFVGESIWNIVQGLGGWQRIMDSPAREKSLIYSQFRDAWMREAERRKTQRALPKRARPQVCYDPASSVEPAPLRIVHEK